MTNTQTSTLKKIFSCFLLSSELRWNLVDAVPQYDDRQCKKITTALNKILKEQKKFFVKLEKSNPEEVKTLVESMQCFERSLKKGQKTQVESASRKEEEDALTSLETQIGSIS